MAQTNKLFLSVEENWMESHLHHSLRLSR